MGYKLSNTVDRLLAQVIEKSRLELGFAKAQYLDLKTVAVELQNIATRSEMELAVERQNIATGLEMVQRDTAELAMGRKDSAKVGLEGLHTSGLAVMRIAGAVVVEPDFESSAEAVTGSAQLGIVGASDIGSYACSVIDPHKLEAAAR